MPPPKFPTRAQQSTTSGLGQAFTSPVKRHARPDKQKLVAPIGRDAKRRRLQAELDALLNPEKLLPPEQGPERGLDIDNNLQSGLEALPFQDSPIENEDASPRPRRTLPDSAGINLYQRWQTVLPRLVDALLLFVSASTGQIVEPLTSLQTTCSKIGCVRKTNTVLCLFQNRESHIASTIQCYSM